MLVGVIWLLVELVLLFFLSRWLTQTLYVFLLLLFRVRSIAISAVTALLFPGTVIHELSHLFTAEILGVRTGKLVLAPESIKDKDIRTGSVAISQTGPFRRTVIGLAPVFIGLAGLSAISYWIQTLWQHLNAPSVSSWFSNPNTYYMLMAAYLLFAISNTMFSSPQDLKGCLPLSLTLGILLAAAYLVGFRLGLTGQALEVAARILESLIRSTGVVLAINIALLLLMNVLIIIMGRLTKTVLVRR